MLEIYQELAGGDIRTLFKQSGNGAPSTIKDMQSLTRAEQRLITSWKQRPDGTIEVRFENRMKALEMLARHYGLLVEHMRLEIASGLTLEEEEKIKAFSDEELAQWNEANDVIHFLLFPAERPQKQLTA